jgi:hypothetical protein
MRVEVLGLFQQGGVLVEQRPGVRGRGRNRGESRIAGHKVAQRTPRSTPRVRARRWRGRAGSVEPPRRVPRAAAPGGWARPGTARPGSSRAAAGRSWSAASAAAAHVRAYPPSRGCGRAPPGPALFVRDAAYAPGLRGAHPARGSGWVHLRLCLSCGHVGCCGSSPTAACGTTHPRSATRSCGRSNRVRRGGGAMWTSGSSDVIAPGRVHRTAPPRVGSPHANSEPS